MQTSLEQQQIIWLALQYIPQLGPITQRKLWQQHGSIDLIWESIETPADQKRQFLNLAQAELESLKTQDVQVLVLSHSSFPDNITSLPDISPVLYCRGQLLPQDLQAIAVVGTRHPSSYGMDATKTLTKQLVAAGQTIISGMAIGIDTIAHAAALDAGGRTIAVLGSSLDMIYPSSNRVLAERIVEHGAIISQFKPGTRAANFTFPARNRLIAGLSNAVVITEARANSGSLITAQAARDYHRPVFAVPGSIFSQGSQGPHQLIRDGASLAVDAAAIVHSHSVATGPMPLPGQLTIASADTAQEERLLQLLQAGPQTIDQLIRASRQTSADILAALSMLELKGAVLKSGEGEYRIS